MFSCGLFPSRRRLPGLTTLSWAGLLPRPLLGSVLQTAIQRVRRRRFSGSVDGVSGQPSGLYASAGQRFGPPLAGTSLKLPPRTLGNLYVGRRLFFAAAGGPHGCLPRLGAGDLGPEARAAAGGPLDASVLCPKLFGMRPRLRPLALAP